MLINYNWLIHNLLNSKGFMVCRMGNVETTALMPSLEGTTSGGNKGIYSQMFTNAGFYGDHEVFKKWKNQYIKALFDMDCHLDVVSCPSFVICGDFLTKMNIWKPTLAYMERIDFWIDLLEIIKKFNKSICIVSYFANEMAVQYKKIKKIFPHKDLSDINIRFVESYNTIKGNEIHKDYNETFTKLKSKLDNLALVERQGTPSQPEGHKGGTNDIYFVSCGCYGLPLCNYIKSKGGNSIYVGGLLQMLFGLKGSRWEKRPLMNKYYNKHWKYPNKKPKNLEQVEGGCYWQA